MKMEDLYRGQKIKDEIEKTKDKLNKFLKIKENRIEEIVFGQRTQINSSSSFRLIICNFDSDETVIKEICDHLEKTLKLKIKQLEKKFEEIGKEGINHSLDITAVGDFSTLKEVSEADIN